MSLMKEIFARAVAAQKGGSDYETIHPKDTVAVVKAGVKQASQAVADQIVEAMVEPRAQAYVEQQLEISLRQFAATFSATDRKTRQAEIREEFINQYVGPLRNYLTYRVADADDELQELIGEYVHYIDDGNVHISWNYGKAICCLILVCALATIVHFSLTFGGDVSQKNATLIDIALVTIGLTIMNCFKKRYFLAAAETQVKRVAEYRTLRAAVRKVGKKYQLSLQPLSNIMDSKQEMQMISEADNLDELRDMRPDQIFTYVFRVNSLKLWFRQEGSMPQLPEEISDLIFRMLLPPYIYNAMAYVAPDAQLALTLPETDSQHGNFGDNDGKQEEEPDSDQTGN